MQALAALGRYLHTVMMFSQIAQHSIYFIKTMVTFFEPHHEIHFPAYSQRPSFISPAPSIFCCSPGRLQNMANDHQCVLMCMRVYHVSEHQPLSCVQVLTAQDALASSRAELSKIRSTLEERETEVQTSKGVEDSLHLVHAQAKESEQALRSELAKAKESEQTLRSELAQAKESEQALRSELAQAKENKHKLQSELMQVEDKVHETASHVGTAMADHELAAANDQVCQL